VNNRYAGAACAGATLLLSQFAWAAFGTDNIQVRLGGGLRYDSNVFRAPGGADVRAPDGSSGRSDWITTVNAGATVVFPVSRQQFLLSADLNQSRYSKFSHLDFDGQDLRGLWRWELGPWLTGDLGAARSKHLASFATTLGVNRNVRTAEQTFFTLNYPFHANWRANFGATEATYANSDPLNRLSDNDTSTRTAGLQYITGAQNYIGVQGTTLETRFKHFLTVGGQTFDNSYDQNSVSAVVGYSPSGLTRVQASVGRTRREPHQPGQPDVSGTTGSLVFNWRPTGKTALTVDYSRDFGPAIDIVTASSAARTLTIAPTWEVTNRITLLGTIRRQERDYTDPTGLVPGGSNRQDKLSAYGLVAVYNPRDRLYVNLSAQHERRDSNVGGQDYTVNVVSATVQWSF
jgi:exopolysaccharide biosynthesis operon protein EpsL